MADLAGLHAVVYGRVQGVFFRAFVMEKALGLGLTGRVRNLPSGKAVEVIAEGEKTKLECLTAFLKSGPPRASVISVTTEWQQGTGKYADFRIES